MYLDDELKAEFQRVSRSAQMIMDARVWVEQNSEKFAKLPTASVINFGDRIRLDFDHLSHDQVMQVVMTFGRPWSREANGARINYIHPVSPTLEICCYAGQPPPNCRVEYVEEIVPAQPERVVRKAKIICKPITHAIPDTETLTIDVNERTQSP